MVQKVIAPDNGMTRLMRTQGGSAGIIKAMLAQLTQRRQPRTRRPSGGSRSVACVQKNSTPKKSLHSR